MNHLAKISSYDPTVILDTLGEAAQSINESAIYQYEREATSGSSATHSLQMTTYY